MGGWSPGPLPPPLDPTLASSLLFFSFQSYLTRRCCSRAGWDKKWTDYKRKGGLQEVLFLTESVDKISKMHARAELSVLIAGCVAFVNTA